MPAEWPRPERRKDDQRLRDMQGQIDDLRRRVQGVENGIAANNVMTAQIAADTAGIRDLLDDGAGAIKTLCRVAAGWRFLMRYVVLPIGAVCLVWWYLTHNYTWPEWFEGLWRVFK